MTDKEILLQMLDREIDNIFSGINPLFSFAAGPIKNFLFSFIEPYIDAFLSPETRKINTKAATAFVKNEVNSKVNEFMKKFESRVNNEPEDYIV